MPGLSLTEFSLPWAALYLTDIGCRMAIIKGYYDGRGNSSVARDMFVVLVGIAASDDDWRDFQELWKQSVNAPLNDLPLSVTDCFGGGKLASVPREDRLLALKAAVDLLADWSNRSDKSGLHVFSSVVMMDEYRAFSGGAINRPEALCVDYIIPCLRGSFSPEDNFEFFFDENERFIRYVKQYWRDTERRRRNGPYYLRNVDILKTVTDTHIPIQAADVYAWLSYTYAQAKWLPATNPPVGIRWPMYEILKTPPISKLWDSQSFATPIAKNRVLESMDKVPAWASRNLYGKTS
jgi:hypothetical protein